MTAFDRFDPFERRITDAIDEIAATRAPDYLTDILRQTARTSQRPRWTFPERWLPVDSTISRPTAFGRLPFRQLIILALLVAFAAAAVALYVGTQKQLPAPFGPARNGVVVYGIDGDLYVRDSMTATPRLLLGGPSQQGGALASPDGQLIAYDSYVGDVDHAWVVGIDGSNPRQILDQPFTGMSFQWSYDSRSAVAVTDSAGYLQLWNAPADGSGAIEIKLDGLWPLEATWDPTRPGVLLVRAEDRGTSDVDLYYVDVNARPATILSKVDMPNGTIPYGTGWHFVAIAFSPDGSTIAYADPEGETSDSLAFRTHLMNRNGTNNRTIGSTNVAGYNQSWPIFSPDGTTIALESWFGWRDGAVNTLAVVPTDLSKPAILVGPSLAHSLIKSWSPDGTRLLVAPGDTKDVYSIDPVSGAYEKLAFELDYVPAWQRLAP
jgi:Tol biopolymer transport system component